MIHPKLVRRLEKMGDPELRDVQQHITLILSLRSIGHDPGRMDYSEDQKDFLRAVGRHSTLLPSENFDMAHFVARKCGRASVLKAYKAVHVVMRKVYREWPNRPQRIAVYEMLAGWAADYREARAPVLDPNLAQQLVADLLDVVAGAKQPKILSSWLKILKQRVYRRQTTPGPLMKELYNPAVLIEHSFPGYLKAGALGLVFGQAFKKRK